MEYYKIVADLNVRVRFKFVAWLTFYASQSTKYCYAEETPPSI